MSLTSFRLTIVPHVAFFHLYFFVTGLPVSPLSRVFSSFGLGLRPLCVLVRSVCPGFKSPLCHLNSLSLCFPTCEKGDSSVHPPGGGEVSEVTRGRCLEQSLAPSVPGGVFPLLRLQGGELTEGGGSIPPC